MKTPQNDQAYNLVIGISGPYGAGASSLSQEIVELLTNWPGCKVNAIHVSDLIKNYSNKIGLSRNVPEDDSSERRKKLQEAGTALRRKDPKLTSKMIVAEISKEAITWEKSHGFSNIGTTIFVVDCLKNSIEANEFKRIYGDEFYLVYVHASREARWRRQVDYRGWKESERVEFEERDKVDYNEKAADPQVGNAGQEVGKLSSMADYYIVNNQNRENLRAEANRLLNLLFGDGKNQPTINERSMHLAFSASNRSYCLSRQVGAAIVDRDGNVLGIGHNDVPKANGGLYTQEEGQNDKRCYLVGDRRCINETNKQERIKDLVKDILNKVELESIEKEKLNKAVEA